MAFENDKATAEDIKRFRMATLKAKLTRMGIVFDPASDESMLLLLIQTAVKQQEERARRHAKRQNFNARHCGLDKE